VETEAAMAVLYCTQKVAEVEQVFFEAGRNYNREGTYN